MEYHTISKGRGLLYVCGSHLYKKYNTDTVKTYLECYERHCKAKAQILHGKLYETSPHEAHNSELLIKELKLKERIRKRAQSEQTSLREIFNSEVKELDIGDRIGFADVESSMYKRRRFSFPPLPSSLSHVESSVSEARLSTMIDGGTFQRFIIDDEDSGYAIVFASDRFFSLLQSSSILLLDGSTKPVPSLFEQLYCLYAKHLDGFFPSAFVLMTRPNHSLYKMLFEKLKEMLPGFSPRRVVMNFKEMSRNAIIEVFPDAETQGSWHDYVQCLIRKIKVHGLLTRFETDLAVQDQIKKLAIMPLLPSNMIVPAFNSIKEDSKESKLDEIFSYVSQEWLEKVGVEKLCVFESPDRTNIAVESIHARLCQRLSWSPNLYVFLSRLRKISVDNEAELERIANGAEMSRTRKKQNVLNDKKIQIALRNLLKGKSDANGFMNSVKRVIGKYIDAFTLNERQTVRQNAKLESESEEDDSQNEGNDEPSLDDNIIA